MKSSMMDPVMTETARPDTIACTGIGTIPIELAGLWFKHFLFSPHCCCQYPCQPPIITKGLEDMGMGFITLTLEFHNGAASLAGGPGPQDHSSQSMTPQDQLS